jgi:cytochrome c
MYMTKLRAILSTVLGLCSAILVADAASAQIALPAAKPPDGAALFKQQCATCHTTNMSEPTRQGPTLAKVVGRKAGKIEGFKYTPGLAQANFIWDDAKLDAWLTNPQAIIPDANMVYRQAKPETRAAIIAYLKELN